MIHKEIREYSWLSKLRSCLKILKPWSTLRGYWCKIPISWTCEIKFYWGWAISTTRRRKRVKQSEQIQMRKIEKYRFDWWSWIRWCCSSIWKIRYRYHFNEILTISKLRRIIGNRWRWKAKRWISDLKRSMRMRLCQWVCKNRKIIFRLKLWRGRRLLRRS